LNFQFQTPHASFLPGGWRSFSAFYISVCIEIFEFEMKLITHQRGENTPTSVYCSPIGMGATSSKRVCREKKKPSRKLQ
jgi:hypothetical protein